MLQVNHDVKPEQKYGKEWILTAAKTIQDDFFGQNHQMFAKNGGKYEENRLYAMNKPPINKFKKLRGIDTTATTSELAVDWTFRGPGSKYADLMIEKILANNYSPVATPIDPTSRDEQHKYIRDMRAKLLTQQSLKQAGVPELADMEQLKTKPTEPQSTEELEMRLNSGEQFNRAMDMELLIDLAFWNNKVSEVLRPAMVRDVVTCGTAVYRDGLDSNGSPSLRRVDPALFGCSYCEQPDFSDIQYAFELQQVPVGTLSQYFTEDEFKNIKNLSNRTPLNSFRLSRIAGDTRFMNPKPGHVMVMEFELFTWDSYHWELRTTSYGNVAQPKIVSQQRAANGAGRKYEYQSKTTKMVLGGKWIVGTDYIYEFGPMPNQKREFGDISRLSGCTLSYKPFAANMHNMICVSMVDKLKPHQDDYMANNISIQNMVNKMVPNGFSFDLDALEEVNMTRGGKAMTPEEIIRLFYRTGEHLFRSKGLTGLNGNSKPITPVQNEDFGSLVALINRQSVIIQAMRDDTGLNELTDGSTPAERTGVGVANLASAATNTALRPLVRLDEFMLTEMGYDMYLRTQQAVKRNPDYGGHIPGINKGTWQYVTADANMPKRQYAIMLEMRATDEQKAQLMQYFSQDVVAGYLSPGDIVMLSNTQSLNRAQSILDWKVKKEKERVEDAKQKNIIQQSDANAKNAVAVEQAKQATIRLGELLEYKRQLAINRGAILETQVTTDPATADAILQGLEKEMIAIDEAVGAGTEGEVDEGDEVMG